MPRYVFGTNDPVEAGQIMALMAGGGHPAGNQAPGGLAPPPGRAPGTMPPPPGGAAAPPPPPQQAAPAAPANPRLDNVLKLMDTYSRAGHQVAGARKVLAQVGLSRAQDANEEQLIWLEQAFANTAWAPG